VAPLLARLDNPIRSYEWGSREVLARLQGRAAPSPTPEAELWLGAHPTAPSTWLLEDGPVPLDVAIGAAPEALLGAEVAARFGPRLPYLLKVLAVAHPLSLQAHPSADQAAAGFARMLLKSEKRPPPSASRLISGPK
jgi:mannose-6-phosphate isomerase